MKLKYIHMRSLSAESKLDSAIAHRMMLFSDGWRSPSATAPAFSAIF